jgi:hypothetical protein
MLDLLVLTSLDLLVFILKLFTYFCYTTYFNEEVNRTEPTPSVRVPLELLSRVLLIGYSFPLQ